MLSLELFPVWDSSQIMRYGNSCIGVLVHMEKHSSIYDKSLGVELLRVHPRGRRGLTLGSLEDFMRPEVVYK